MAPGLIDTRPKPLAFPERRLVKVFETRGKGQEEPVSASRRNTDTETRERWEHFVSADGFNIAIINIICCLFFYNFYNASRFRMMQKSLYQCFGWEKSLFCAPTHMPFVMSQSVPSVLRLVTLPPSQVSARHSWTTFDFLAFPRCAEGPTERREAKNPPCFSGRL